jgi:hypothetical protein
MGLWAWFKRLLGLGPKGVSRGPSVSPAKQRQPPSMSAADMLQRVEELQQSNAQWPEIWQVLNPDGDERAQRLLVEFRGPHMFAPHVGLNILEDFCRRILAHSPNADRLIVLDAAVKGVDPFVRPD